jgi:menaquinone-9 beta-reductase
MNAPHVLVVGAGPAGSSTAIHLARAGIRVTLIDRATFPREKACAEYCSPGIVDALDELGVLGRLCDREHRYLPAMRIVARDKEISLDFHGETPSKRTALGIKRSILDEELLNVAAAAGATVFEQSRALRPILHDGTVIGATVRHESTETDITSDFVVIADGLNSTLARSLGLHRPITWPFRLGLVARFSGLPEQVTAGQMHIGQRIYCGMSPISDHEANVSLVVPMGSKPAGLRTGEFFDHMIRTLPGIDQLLGNAKRITDVRGVGPLGKNVQKTSGPGYLLVGDAAGFFDPLTGEGIHRALTGGKLAAEAVQTALETGQRQPIGYDQQRKAAFRDKQRVCAIIQGLISNEYALSYVANRAGNRPMVNDTLRGILGDFRPAREALKPGFLWNLLRP